jgi:hypothetical protein
MPPLAEAQVAHHIPGRLRLKVARLKTTPELAEELLRELGNLDEILKVRVRPVAESVLVHYTANGRESDTILATVGSVLEITERQAPLRSPPVPPPPDVSVGEIAGEWAHERWRRLDQGLLRVSDGALDMRTLVPLFFLYLAVRQFLIQPNLSAIPWYTALYWAYQSFNRYYGRPTPPPRSGWSQADEEGSADP